MRTGLLSVLLLAACDQASAELSLPADVTLRTGEQRSIRGTTVTFVEVTEDSRCPLDARCDWAGNAKVELRLEAAAESTLVVLNSELDPKVIEAHGLRLRIVSLEPYPRVGAPAPTSHELTLRVESTR